jgi:FMN-dependent NADH-azoreductase
MSMPAGELKYRTVTLNKDVLNSPGGHFLHLDASESSESVVAHGAKKLLGKLAELQPDVRIECLQLWDEGVRAKMDYNLAHVRAKMNLLSGSAQQEDIARFAVIEELAMQIASARAIIVSASMWNYGAPWVLKQYFDCVAHLGLTFQETPGGGKLHGLLGTGRPLVVITSGGGVGSIDHLTPWLRDVAAMLGFSRAVVVSATRSDNRQEVLDNIERDAEKAAADVVRLASEPAGLSDEVDEVELRGLVGEDWGHEELLKWLLEQGGLSDDALDTLREVQVSGQHWYKASEADWQDEELDLQSSDIKRIVELQVLSRERWAAANTRLERDAAVTR